MRNTTLEHDRFAYVWLLLGWMLLIVSNGRYILPPAAWLALALLLRFVRTQRILPGLTLGLITTIIAYMINFFGVIPLHGGIYYITMTGIGVILFLPFVLDRLFSPYLTGSVRSLVFPCTFVTLEYVNAVTNPFGNWSALAYTQYGNLPLMQVVSLTGLWGLSFLVAWGAAMLNQIWEYKQKSWQDIPGLTMFIGVLLAIVFYGNGVTELLSSQEKTVMIAGFVEGDYRTYFPELNQLRRTGAREDFIAASRRIQQTYLNGTARVARTGAKIIVWPEAAGIVALEDEARLIGAIEAIARTNSIFLVATLEVFDQDVHAKVKNMALIVNPRGEIVLQHKKYGGAFIDNLEAGDRQLHPTNTVFGELGVVICWDADFPLVLKQIGRNGTDILFIPALDWRPIDPLHTRMAVFRGIENGVAVVRVAASGLSLVTDARGRVLAAMDHYTITQDRLMIAQVPVQGIRTVYAVIGNSFAYISMAGLVGIIAWTVVKQRRRCPPGEN